MEELQRETLDTLKSQVAILKFSQNKCNMSSQAVGTVRGFPGGSDGKESPAMQETQVQFLGWEDPLEKGSATHFSVLGLAWQNLPEVQETWVGKGANLNPLAPNKIIFYPPLF